MHMQKGKWGAEMRTRSLIGISLLLILLASLAIPVSAYVEGTNIKWIGSYPVNTFRNYVYNGTLYSQEGGTTRIYNVSTGVNLSTLTFSSFGTELPVGGNDYAVDSGKLYILTGTHLEIYDVSTYEKQLDPVFLGNVTTGASVAFSRVAVNGSYAYVGVGTFKIIDISDPAHPLIVSTLSVPAEGVATDGRYAYIGAWHSNDNFVIVDALDPENPSVVNTTDIGGGGVSGIAYRNDTLYVASYATNWQTWDVTSRTAPVKLQENHWNAVHLSIYDRYLFVSVRYGEDYPFTYGGWAVYNITNKTPPTSAVSYGGRDGAGNGAYDPFFGYTEDIHSDGNVVAISCNSNGEWIYSFLNQTTAYKRTRISVLTTPYALESQSVGNLDILAVGGRNQGTWYLNITDPEIATSQAPLAAWNPYSNTPRQYDQRFYNNYSYVNMGTNGNGFWAVNLTGIENQPFIPSLGVYNMSVNSQVYYAVANETRVWVDGYTGIVSEWNNTCKDSCLNEKIWSKTVQPDGEWANLWLYNNTVNSSVYLMILNGNRFMIYDVTTDNGTKVYDSTATGGFIKSAYDPVSNHIYTIKSGSARSIDVTDIDNIHYESGTVPYYLTTSYKMVCNGTDVFLTGYNGNTDGASIYMFDFSNPAAPVLVDSASLSGLNEGMAYHKGYLYVGNENVISIWRVYPSGGSAPEDQILPTVSWSPDVTSGVSPLTVHFTDLSVDSSPYNTTGGIPIEWYWEFGDTGTSNQTNPVHTFYGEGTYNVSLRIRGAEGYNTSGNQTITVQLLNADFYANRTWNSTVPFPVGFTSMEQYGVDYFWDFGDGENATTRNATHTYTAAGTYTVNYTITNGTESSSKIRTDYITIPTSATNVYYAPGSSADARLGNTGVSYGYNLFPPKRNASGNYLESTSTVNGSFIAVVMTASNAYDPIFGFGWSADTSDIPDNANIDSAVFSLYPDGVKSNGLGTNASTAVITAFGPANPASLAMSDWQTRNWLTYSNTINYTSWSTSARNNFTLSNLSVINKSGYTSLLATELCDINNACSIVTSGNSKFGFYDTAKGDPYKPYLQVSFSLSADEPPAPVADFIMNVTSGEAPLPVQFYDASSGNPTSWNWSFGEGNVSTDQNPNFTFVTPGTYNVTLTATNEVGSDSESKIVLVEGPAPYTSPPVAAFSCTPLTGAAPLLVSCMDESLNTPTEWAWDFGDGNTSTLEHPNNTYSAEGLQSISLNVTNAGGSDTLEKTDYVNVTAQEIFTPVADFECTPLTGNLPLTVSCTDLSTNSPDSWLYEFSVGGVVISQITTQNGSVELIAPGIRNVTLYVSNAAGSDSTTKSEYITPIPVPIADFRATNTTVTIGTAVQFIDASDYTPTAWNWSFGDGNTSSEQDPLYDYPAVGVYDISLTVTNFFGEDNLTRSGYITVTETGYPTTDFSANITAGDKPLSVQFTDLSGYDPDSWNWSFGEGNYSVSQNPVHIYTDYGLYTVSLNATNPNGSTVKTRADYINVSQPLPIVDFSASNTTICLGNNTVFTDLTINDPLGWYWQFGDTQTSTDQNPEHTYAAGTFSVSLTAENAAGNNITTKNNYITVTDCSYIPPTPTPATPLRIGDTNMIPGAMMLVAMAPLAIGGFMIAMGLRNENSRIMVVGGAAVIVVGEIIVLAIFLIVSQVTVAVGG